MSFENPEFWWLVLRSALIVAAFFVFARALLVSRRDSAVQFAQLTAHHAQTLAEVQRLTDKLGELNEQVRELSLPSPVTSQRLQGGANYESQSAPAPLQASLASPPVRGYEMAIRMARGGASIEDIVTGCGTTRAEARLLRRLHYADGAHAA